MTVLVGVRCTDGVVIGADGVATSAAGASRLMQVRSNDKIRIFDNRIICAATGAVGLSQRLMVHVEAALNGGVFANLPLHECTANISKRFIADCQGSMTPFHHQYGYGCGALIAGHIKGAPRLIEFGITDFQAELKDGNLFFVSMGSGQTLAEPFMAFVARVLWKQQVPTVDEAKFGVYWALEHTIKHAPGGVGHPIKLAALRSQDGKWVASEIVDTQEAAQYVNELEAKIGEFAREAIDQAKVASLPAPPPVK